MEAIYGKRGIKSGYKKGPRTLLLEAARQLLTKGADVIIAACTEVSLVLEAGRAPFEIVDPMEVLARVAVERARPGEAQRELAAKSQAVR